MDIQTLISRTLRFGVFLACSVAFIGGILYLFRHGMESFDISQYQNFSYSAAHDKDYTTLSGIVNGFMHSTPVGWIQMGVLILILTPIMRIVLSFVDFVKEHDWLYAVITAIVLAVIVTNSFEGVKF